MAIRVFRGKAAILTLSRFVLYWLFRKDVYSTLLPRIKRLCYSLDWQDGKPQSDECISHVFKYLKLESYEDALNNLILKRSKGQQNLLDQHAELREDYLLGYWLDVETQDSASLLNLDCFEDPFNYRLNIATGTANAARPTKIDLVETFNYLLDEAANAAEKTLTA